MNFWIWFLAVYFWFMENRYFGWNAHPQSEAELICDGIVILLVALAFLKRGKCHG
ncbi:hypothetical protein [Pseudomonas aeruginosa]|uniref:hypothetical protein n=1 Tax=Pseudomonas aeruginosa TaxID=287 RepID=UPI002FE6A2BD